MFCVEFFISQNAALIQSHAAVHRQPTAKVSFFPNNKHILGLYYSFSKIEVVWDISVILLYDFFLRLECGHCSLLL